MAAEGFLSRGQRKGGVDEGHGVLRLLSFRWRPARTPARVCRQAVPAPERPFTARIPRAGACAGAGAFRGGAVRAPDCARARQAEDAPRLSAESGSFRTGPARAGRGPRGLRLPWTHPITDFRASDQNQRNITCIIRTYCCNLSSPPRKRSHPRLSAPARAAVAPDPKCGPIRTACVLDCACPG